ncbi:predicted protein [Botrytis cinerea T4]|uniref:Uncharacterized protein n=1 Tax=Botryotinia fuckeliana (strain T4) TaxID=999810 RepID=G2YH56_BOTF4|nr:predicted protein [Botrytis cinerea T4]
MLPDLHTQLRAWFGESPGGISCTPCLIHDIEPFAKKGDAI